jgi:TonB family protein
MKAQIALLLSVLAFSITSFGCAKPDVKLENSGLPSATASEHQASTAKLAESQFRRLIVESPLPTYPATEGKAPVVGPVVVSVYIGPDGSLRSTQVLESPSDGLAKAVTNALKTWKFVGFAPAAGPMGVKSKLTFYLAIANGVPTVRLAPVAPIPRDLPDAFPRTIDLPAFEELKSRIRVQIIDVRQREAFGRAHLPEARSIPSDEISSRALAELDLNLAVVIDCRSADMKLCSLSSARLSQLGFGNVYQLIPQG